MLHCGINLIKEGDPSIVYVDWLASTSATICATNTRNNSGIVIDIGGAIHSGLQCISK